MLRVGNVLEETCSKIIYFCNKNSLRHGICVHSAVLKLGIRDNLILSNNLLSLYEKCDGVERARHLFDEMPHRDFVSWTCILSAYSKHGNHEEALRLFDLMKASGENPNEFTFSNVLRSCSASRNLSHGARVHACLVKSGFSSNPILCSSLIELYSKRGFLEDAVEVFNGMTNGDIISWTSMISSFVQAGDWVRALLFFLRMIKERVPPNEYTFVQLVTACGLSGRGDYGKLVHAQFIIRGVEMNLVLKTALVNMYGKCRKMENAVKVLKQTPEQDVQLWTMIISGFNQNSNFREAVLSFKQMLGNNIASNNYSFAAMINACSSAQGLKVGKQIHAKIIMAELDSDTYVENSLLDFYAKCLNAMKDVAQVFSRMTEPNAVSWTTLIAGLAKHGREHECFLAFTEMRFSGHRPNSYTLSNILEACGTGTSTSSIGTRKIHGFVIKTRADDYGSIGNALIDAYAGLLMVDCAMSLAKRARHVIAYTVLGSKLNQMGLYKPTLEIIKHMREDELPIDGFIISSFLSAAADLGSVQTGEQLHCYSIVSGLLKYVSVSNGLIDFYGKCQCVLDSQKAFEEISEPDVVSWNSLIHSFALNGPTESSLSALEDMRMAGIRPDSHTLSTVLFACSKVGLVDMGLEYFHSLREIYDIRPLFYHYNILVDLLGKAGRLEEAVSLVKSMPFGSNNASVYKRLLCACRLHGNVILGEEIARTGLEFDPGDSEFYVILANIYDEAGLTELGNNMRGSMKDGGLRKTSLSGLVANR